MSSLVVRVRLRIRSKETNKSIELPVLVNGGAESPKPCVVVPTEVAKELGFWPPKEVEVYLVEEASSTSEVYLVPNALELELLGDEGEVLSRVDADLAVQEGLSESLITDITIDELGIQVISFSRGLWRHKNDSPDIIRKSVSVKY